MRSVLRTDRLVRNVLAMGAAAFVVGASFGAIASAAGLSFLKIAAMSIFVFAGGSQFMAVGIVGAGGTALAAVLAGLLLNARHLPFGLAVGDLMGRTWPTRLIGSHLLVDETVAFALGQEDPRERHRAYWLSGAALFACWNLGTLVGAGAGNVMGDPTALGVDAAFPAGMLALLLPSLVDRKALRVAVAGAVVAVATTPFLPPGMPVLVALLALVFALPVPRWSRPAPGDPAPDAGQPVPEKSP